MPFFTIKWLIDWLIDHTCAYNLHQWRHIQNHRTTHSSISFVHCILVSAYKDSLTVNDHEIEQYHRGLCCSSNKLCNLLKAEVTGENLFTIWTASIGWLMFLLPKHYVKSRFTYWQQENRHTIPPISVHPANVHFYVSDYQTAVSIQTSMTSTVIAMLGLLT